MIFCKKILKTIVIFCEKKNQLCYNFIGMGLSFILTFFLFPEILHANLWNFYLNIFYFHVYLHNVINIKDFFEWIIFTGHVFKDYYFCETKAWSSILVIRHSPQIIYIVFRFSGMHPAYLWDFDSQNQSLSQESVPCN